MAVSSAAILFTRHGRYNTHETSAHLVKRKEKKNMECCRHMIISEIKLREAGREAAAEAALSTMSDFDVDAEGDERERN